MMDSSPCKDDKEETPTPPPTFDKLLTQVGEFGPYQRLLFFALWLPAAASAVGIYTGVFTEFAPNHECRLPEECQGKDSSWLLNVPDPSCTILNASTCQPVEDRTSLVPVPCPNGFRFDASMFPRTAVTEFEAVCEKAWLGQASSMCYMMGMLFGSFFFGSLSDAFGRRFAFGLATIFLSLGSTCAAVTPNYPLLIAARFIASMGGIGLFIIAFVLSMEFVGPKRRTLCGIAIEIPFALGELYLVGMAYFIRDWRMLQIALAVPFYLFLAMLLVLPESIRWALSKKKFDLARKELKRLGRVNKKELQEEDLEQWIEAESLTERRSLGLSDLLTSSSLRPRLLIMALNWVVATLSYYGLGMAASLSKGVFLTFTLTAATEVPAYLFAMATVERWGRKPVLVGSQFLAALSCIVAGCLPASLSSLTLALTVLGKVGASAAFAIVFLYTAELFPTPLRNSAVGLCSTCARLGGIISPVVNSLGKSVAPQAPFLVIGVSSLAGGLTAFWLPETKGRPLPDTLEEAMEISSREVKA